MSLKNTNYELFKMRSLKNFGGSKLKSNPKVARPLSTKLAVHVVLKSALAQGRRSLLHSKNVDKIHAVITNCAKQCGVRIYHYVNVGNHIHLVVKLHDRQTFKAFLRSVTGLIARHVLGAQRNHPQGLTFWEARPFTRLVSWGRDYKNVGNYMESNRWESTVRKQYIRWSIEIFDGLNTC